MLDAINNEMLYESMNSKEFRVELVSLCDQLEASVLKSFTVQR